MQGGLPALTWGALRAFRQGFGAVAHPEQELALYLSTTEDWIEAQGDSELLSLHRDLFAPPGTANDSKIRALLERHPVSDQKGRSG
jgi:hypothetical protein